MIQIIEKFSALGVDWKVRILIWSLSRYCIWIDTLIGYAIILHLSTQGILMNISMFSNVLPCFICRNSEIKSMLSSIIQTVFVKFY